MLKVARAPTPADFWEKVTNRGLRAVAEMIGSDTTGKTYQRKAGKPFKKTANYARDIPPEKLPPYWRDFLNELMSSYSEVCAYSCMRIHPVTGGASVDHFAAKSTSWRRAYLWSNYRLCCSRLNSKKNKFDDVIDPFRVIINSFQLELLTFQVKPDDTLEAHDYDMVKNTIERLGLNDFCADREAHAEDYWKREITLKILRRESPFVAREIHRQNRLNIGDIW